MSPTAWIIYFAVGTWLATTLISQHTRYGAILARSDVFRILPRWTFFAPNPGVKDYHVVVRDKSEFGELGPWRTIPFAEARNRFNIVWNPQKRPKKVLNDAVQMLRLVSTGQRDGVLTDAITLPYLMLLAYSFASVPIEEGKAERQFAIVESTGHDRRDLTVVYLSLFHPM